MLVTVNTSNDIKSRASKGLAGLAGPNWLNIEEVLPAFQVQAKMQAQRFKDQTFEQLEKLVQIKVLEEFLDVAIKGRKGKLPYNSLPDHDSVVRIAPWFPADVVYKRPREMEPVESAEVFKAIMEHAAQPANDLLLKRLTAKVGSLGFDPLAQQAILAAMRRFNGSVGNDEVQQDVAGDAIAPGVVKVDGQWLLDGEGTTQGGIKQCQVSLLPQAEHNKMYVRDGTITLCRTTIALHDLHNAAHAAGVSSEGTPDATASGEDAQLSAGAVPDGGADVAEGGAASELAASGGCQGRDLPVPSDSPADGAGAAADLGGDAGVQVSGGTGVATEGGDGVAGDLDAAACSMEERSTVRQLRQRRVGSALPAGDCAAIEGVPAPPRPAADGSTTRRGARLAGGARIQQTCGQAASTGGPAETATIPVRRVHWADAAHDSTGDVARLGNFPGRVCTASPATPGTMAAAHVLSMELPAGVAPARKSKRPHKPSTRITAVAYSP
ncbi:hypothetical protein COCSUDRAFT_57683 [Coccomyxa subellipsoidea C-169]|uniref:Uncharacterized protein n=1 Tax=Coccomyxa subellipsoidea (strain C-169) TaxID=574566 RepID=I0YJE1_COCSC|nr:hypothetical protein COCSUDRAFT_60177 [Coccomyxa subellipsoidea C-169]XP_005645080.1 hypothetical protein COCSUDRAFT_57683 [Coccomyxa subellipsoidea C-169]EIE18510.1 hypothetical protein COCSUDRAFT_60177 [Coccomyxa subellipsoidea C-169]EIE20536.1 hypothetical protein COCSUDRAFT_57683 [Coccomyxa subellipsoidea C-169]|eukprot:XP_005643054.1 hypothetical protein COCSUDRAFT_60177 [Coccomyxa subellipsoidea C-169]